MFISTNCVHRINVCGFVISAAARLENPTAAVRTVPGKYRLKRPISRAIRKKNIFEILNIVAAGRRVLYAPENIRSAIRYENERLVNIYTCVRLCVPKSP